MTNEKLAIKIERNRPDSLNWVSNLGPSMLNLCFFSSYFSRENNKKFEENNIKSSIFMV